MMGCEVCEDAIASGKIRCHCPAERDGSPAQLHDHKWVGHGGTQLTCPVKLYEANHGHNGTSRHELARSLDLITKTVGADYDADKVLAVRRGLLDEKGDN